MGAALPFLAPIAGGLLSNELNKPTRAEKATTAAQQDAAQAQAAEIQRQTQARKELEALIKSLEPLSGEAKNELIGLRPGKAVDFSGVRGTGDIDLLMQLAGLGSSTGALNSASALAQQGIQSGQQSTSNTVQSLVELLLGLGQGGGGAAQFNQGLGASGLTTGGLLNLGNNAFG